MEKVRFGKTELKVSKIAFGGIPIQRLNQTDAAHVVRGAIELGVNFIDTANGYTDSEEKIGRAIKDFPRDSLVIATKSGAQDKKTLLEHLDLSLKRLGTDYIDIYQLHGLRSFEAYTAMLGENGVFEGMTEAIRAGKVRFPAFSSHNIPGAVEIMRDGKFAVVQLAFNYIDDMAALEAIPLAKDLDMGFIAMKPFGGGLLSDAGLSMRYLMQYDSIVPDPGIEKLSEIEELVRLVSAGDPFSPADAETIGKLKEQMGDYWCHRCDYCRQCPQGIPISMVLNVESFIKRMPPDRVIGMVSKSMEVARGCTACRNCVEKCPYDLDIPELIGKKLALWDKYVSENSK